MRSFVNVDSGEGPRGGGGDPKFLICWMQYAFCCLMLNHLSDEEDIDEMKETCEQDVKVELDTLSGWTLHNILYLYLSAKRLY